MPNQKVAFVIVGWNNQSLLVECISSIKKQTYKNIKIIFVDNNSSDKSIDLIKNKFPDVDLVEMQKNTGFAKGNNIGIKRALEYPQISYIALLNTDAILEPNWTETILNTAVKKPKGAAFQTITLDYYNHSVIDSTHIYVAHNGQATQGSWRRPILGVRDLAPQKIFGCNAAAVMYSRDFIEAQPFDDFFDEAMFMYLEDVDVAARSIIMGWDNYVIPGSRAYHMGSVSSGKNPGFALYMTFRNNSAMLVKNFPLIILIRMLPKLIRGDIDTVKVLWRSNKKNDIKSVVWGRIAGVLRAPTFLIKRIMILKHKKTSYKEIWKIMYRGY